MNNKSRLERFIDFGGKPCVAEKIHAAPEKEVCVVLNQLRKILHLDDSSDPAEIQKAMHQLEPSRSFFIDDTFIFDGFKLNAADDDLVFLLWDDWNDIDTTRFGILNDEFQRLWFPVADDLDIIDANGRWAILITHYGLAKVHDDLDNMNNK
jgi:hypothetical protein